MYTHRLQPMPIISTVVDKKSTLPITSQPIEYGFHRMFLGICLIARFQEAICHLSFVEGSDKKKTLDYLVQRWPGVPLSEASQITGETLRKALSAWQEDDATRSIKVLLKGTPFQSLVWKALLTLPRGTTRSYGEIANQIRRPQAARAVGQAVGDNPIALLIPCHRVIYQGRRIGGYRWGLRRKKRLLVHENPALNLGEV